MNGGCSSVNLCWVLCRAFYASHSILLLRVDWATVSCHNHRHHHRKAQQHAILSAAIHSVAVVVVVVVSPSNVGYNKFLIRLPVQIVLQSVRLFLAMKLTYTGPPNSYTYLHNSLASIHPSTCPSFTDKAHCDEFICDFE